MRIPWVWVGSIRYIALTRDQLVEQYGYLEGAWQYVLAIGLILVVLEMARRAIKLALPSVALLALMYGVLGEYLPGEFAHPGLPLGSFLGTLNIAEGGIWGPLTGVSVNVVAVFVILGAFIGAGEGGTAFMSLATRLVGRDRAGAAKVSVLVGIFRLYLRLRFRQRGIDRHHYPARHEAPGLPPPALRRQSKRLPPVVVRSCRR